MHPNYAQDAPPTTIMVGGYAYPANVDYRVWLDVMKCMRNMYSDPATDEQAFHNAEIIDEIQTLVFGGVLADENISETIHAIVEFSKGYPTAKNDHEPETGPQVVSFEHDLNYIIICFTKNKYKLCYFYICFHGIKYWRCCKKCIFDRT